MKQVITRKLPKVAAVPISLSVMLSDSLRVRRALQTNQSGYPTGSHIIGRLMNRFDFTTKTTMMESILHMRNIVRVAGEILDRYISVKTEKYVFSRTEMISIITTQAPMLGFNDLSNNDIELIAALIVDTETDLSSWTLQCGAADDNFHVKMSHLYESCAPSSNPSFEFSQTNRRFINTSPNGIPVYDPDRDTIVPLTETRRAQAIAAEITNEGTESNAMHRLSNMYTVYQFANMRVIDHMYSMFLDTDNWRNYVSVRMEVNLNTNKERVKSLKLFSSYLHSLLMYSHFFTLECFRKMYSQLEEFAIPFPPLNPHLISTYELVVSSKDALNAKGDVANIFEMANVKGDSMLDTSLFGLPLELLDTFGLTELIQESERVAAGLALPLTLTDINMFNDPSLNELLMSQPINTFNMLGTIPYNILVGNLVESEIKDAIMAISPGTNRYFSEEQLQSLRNANFAVKFSIAYPYAVSLDPTKVSADDIMGNTLEFNPLLHRQCSAVEMNLQRDQIFRFKKGSQFIEDYDGVDVIVNRDKVMDLQDHMNCKWNTLMPNQIGRGIHIKSRETLLRDNEVQRTVLESISGESYNYIGKSINNPQTREKWATVISSFGLLYSFPSQAEVAIRGKIKTGTVIANDAINAFLRPGYGMPYGTTYLNLAAKQGPAVPEDFFQVDELGLVFIRVLKKVPLPDNKLSVTNNFYLSKPYYYFMSNSATIDVDKFVLDEGMQNFALIPTMYEGKHPNIILDKLSAYLNDSVFMNIDWSQVPTRDTRCKQSINIVTKKWVHDKLIEFLSYTSFGHYSDLMASTTSLDSEEKTSILNKMVTEMEETTKDIIATSPGTQESNSKGEPIKNLKLEFPKVDVDDNGKRRSGTSMKKEEQQKKEEDMPKEKKKGNKEDDKDNFDDALNG